MTAERFAVPEQHAGGRAPEVVDEPEWRTRLRAAVERTVSQRAARDEHRRALTARRAAGLQARQAARLARLDEIP
ncbi:hypothetical protein GCM10022251_46570 [Phytohabitans flavus]|uniref:Uncharacterized protein n=1 Tax=Phytohabitans flavus TaxID=1076124 RepID=A0A6F8Y7X8_9ACTN|nr:hypothetical protein [Phytohabitans flavus]BCB82224.1 hypothetical protein Pflav_086340 [Phytohabitans flavus]